MKKGVKGSKQLLKKKAARDECVFIRGRGTCCEDFPVSVCRHNSSLVLHILYGLVSM
jgi:hypothetical protein